MLRPA
jgi:hypothetical protein